jgi:hypothetical protein
VNGAASGYADRVGFAVAHLDNPTGATLAGRYGPGPSTPGIVYFDRQGQVHDFARRATPEELRDALDQLLAV